MKSNANPGIKSHPIFFRQVFMVYASPFLFWVAAMIKPQFRLISFLVGRGSPRRKLNYTLFTAQFKHLLSTSPPSPRRKVGGAFLWGGALPEELTLFRAAQYFVKNVNRLVNLIGGYIQMSYGPDVLGVSGRNQDSLLTQLVGQLQRRHG